MGFAAAPSLDVTTADLPLACPHSRLFSHPSQEGETISSLLVSTVQGDEETTAEASRFAAPWVKTSLRP